MKKQLVLLVMILFAGAGILHASAVADMAKKERARREALHRQGIQSKVFTNADVVNLKSSLAFQSTGETEWVAPEETAQQPESEQNNEEKEALKQEREELVQKAQNARQTIDDGGGYFTRNIGDQFKAKREAEQRMNEIDEKLRKAERGESDNEEPASEPEQSQ